MVPWTPCEIQRATGRKMAARRDAALIAVVSIAAAIICVKALLGWTRLHERLQLVKLPASLLFVACCLVWFSARRYIEARDQRVRTRSSSGVPRCGDTID
jgi:hypothetical protein